MQERTVDGFWFVWKLGMEWPEQFYSEKAAKDRARTIAQRSPGQSVYVGDLAPKERMILPDALQVDLM